MAAARMWRVNSTSSRLIRGTVTDTRSHGGVSVDRGHAGSAGRSDDLDAYTRASAGGRRLAHRTEAAGVGSLGRVVRSAGAPASVDRRRSGHGALTHRLLIASDLAHCCGAPYGNLRA